MIPDEIKWNLAAGDFYLTVPDEEEWDRCPTCYKRPRIWIFDNGRYAKCQCDKLYKGARVSAECITDYVKRNNGSVVGYDYNELRKNWNKYIKTNV